MTLPRMLLAAAVAAALAASTVGAADQAKSPSRPSVSDAMKLLDLIRPASPSVAPDFKATLADGTTFQLSGQRGKVVFINFWATWCLPCGTEMPMMESLWRRHQTRSFIMLAVSTDSTPSAGFTFAVALDPAQELAKIYGLRGLPMSVIIDPAGNVAGLAIGPRDWDRAAADALIEGLMP